MDTFTLNLALPVAFGEFRGNKKMTKLQIQLLVWLHGLTEAQANTVSGLIWGAGQ
ncbi:hypothetical protein [Roseovarius lutimaris]|uniref:hypothetical protein n=1 Tax=Roseovarius lutimaris TaxID=1005928 RepID=UPI0015A69B4D|nr:hypothetical protein [Roseovarius lutimaris]